MASYEVTNAAEADLIAIYTYGAERFGDGRAEEYVRRLHTVFSLYRKAPEYWSRRRSHPPRIQTVRA